MIFLRRRHFVTGLGAALLAGPFAASLNRKATAQQSKTAKYLILFYTPTGVEPSSWAPTGQGSEYSFPTGSMFEPLQNYTAPGETTVTDFRKDLIVLQGINLEEGAGHGAGSNALFTGTGRSEDASKSENKGASVDQHIAAQPLFTAQRRSLELGVKTTAENRVIYGVRKNLGSDGGNEVPPQNRPSDAFNDNFRLLLTSDDPAQELEKKRKKSVLEVARGDLTALSSCLGKEEKLKLDQHLNSIGALEKRLDGTLKCADPMVPSTIEETQTLGKAQIDLMITALTCGLTKIVSLQWFSDQSEETMPWLPGKAGTAGAHNAAHSYASDPDVWKNYVRGYSEQFAYLLHKLKTTLDPEDGQPLLSHVAVLWPQQMGDGNAHSGDNIPVILAGQAGGHWQTGRAIDAGGKSHRRVLASVCHACGVPVKTFGGKADESISGPLTDLTSLPH